MIELSKGQDVALTGTDEQPLTRIRMGLGWKKTRSAGYIGSGAPDVDLDATAVQFAGGRLFDLAFYNNLRTRDGSVEHLGDNLSGQGAGDDEAIFIDLTKVYAKVDVIMLMVSSYQGHTLEYVAGAYCRLTDERDPEQPTELARLTLTLGVPQTGLAMAKLYRGDGGWRLAAIGQGIAAKIPSESIETLRPFL